MKSRQPSTSRGSRRKCRWTGCSICRWRRSWQKKPADKFFGRAGRDMSFGSIRLLCSAISHMPLLFTLRDSGVTQKHGFDLEIDIAGFESPGKPARPMTQRASLLLNGEYEFLSGLHHQTYVHRAKGDKRFVYLAQTQNDWDDRLIARPEISSLKELEGKKILNNGNPAPCVLGNLIEALREQGVDAGKIEFVSAEEIGRASCR